MILVDTSAWVEFLRATGSPVHLRLRELVQSDDALATTEPVVMEVLAGARDEAHLERLRRAVLGRCELLDGHSLADYEEAAAIYRRCRNAGATVRRLADCLVAAVALRADVPVLHADHDFEHIARHCGLRTA
ncbi:MAG TPA: PIN domain nuclease [Candidatus Dormibacteraeota bacterium]|nr:PIN domain nuclease [Candidatus Dormibacteraeota bacterium]